MKKNIIWAIREGNNIRKMINDNGCNHFVIHIYNNGENRIEATYIKDNNVRSIFRKYKKKLGGKK